MKNHWMKNISGSVTVLITGEETEKILNHLIKENIILWNVNRHSPDSITLRMNVKNVRFLRKAVREHRVKVRFIEKKGLPFFLKRARKHLGFIISFAFALILILLLSNMIWKVEIKGASPEVEYELMKQLKQLGVRIGQFQIFVDDPQVLQKKLTEMNDDITWIGVQLTGTTYQFQVVEKSRPKKQEPLSPGNLVAKKEAVIVDYFIERGQPMVKRNEFVKPGQLLVSGDMEDESGSKFPAKGQVLGKIWYKTEAEIKMKGQYELLTGESFVKRTLKIGKLSIPLQGSKEQGYSHKREDADIKTFRFFKWTLPIQYEKTTIYEMELNNRILSETEARQMAIKKAERDLMLQLPKDAKIENKKILHESVESGTFKISILFDVIENIAKEQPIIQDH